MKDMTTFNTPITEGQIGKINELLAAKLRKHTNALPKGAMQQLLEDEKLADALFEVMQKRINAVNGMIARTVKVNRNQSPQEALAATGRKRYTGDGGVESMPKGGGEEVTVYFFKVGKKISEAQLEKEFELRGLKAADPYSLAAVNQADPAFADEHPNATHWKDKNEKWCCAYFDRWSDERGLGVFRYGRDWGGNWWFGGLRK